MPMQDRHCVGPLLFSTSSGHTFVRAVFLRHCSTGLLSEKQVEHVRENVFYQNHRYLVCFT